MKWYAKLLTALIGILAVIGSTALTTALLSYPAMLLWNWLMPIISNGIIHKLTFLQTAGLIFLIRIFIPVSSSNSTKKNEEDY